MNAVVVDTDVVSFLFKGHSSASLYTADLTGRVLVISFMTLAELERWPIQAQWGEARRNRLRELPDSVCYHALGSGPLCGLGEGNDQCASKRISD